MKVTGHQLRNNSRFYILVFSLLLSIGVLAWLRLAVESDQLWLIRVQQVYGFICLGFWYVVLIISPLGYVVGKQRMRHIEFARRAIGVSAFYFALLHGVVALAGQLGGLGQVQYLPSLFQWSLLGGVVALGMLAVMAATSFDAVVRFMTFRRWKWLHRGVYLAGVVAILHVWTIGTHLAYPWVQWVGFGALAVLIGLEVYRVVLKLNSAQMKLKTSEAAVLGITAWAIVVLLVFALPSVVQNYHSRHAGHEAMTGVAQ